MKKRIDYIFIFLFMLMVCLPAKRVYADTARYNPHFVTDTEKSKADCYVIRANIESIADSGNDYCLLNNYYSMDLSKIDGFQFSYKAWLQACQCQRPNVNFNGKITYIMGGNATGQINEDNVSASYNDVETKFSKIVEIYRYGVGNDDTLFCLYATGERCATCGLFCHRILSTKDVYLYDYRGVCTGINSYVADEGESVVITPTFNEYTERVDYKIRYEGETSYSNLIAGTERNGMYVSIGANHSVTLSNINKSNGSFDILPMPYDRSGALPYGFNEMTETKVSHITFPDTQKPIITQLQSVYDRTLGTVTVGFSATDNKPLPTDCFSFDGGAYSSVNVKTYSVPGTYYVSVIDSSNNVTVKEFSVTESDVAKNTVLPEKKTENASTSGAGTVLGTTIPSNGGIATNTNGNNTKPDVLAGQGPTENIASIASGVLDPSREHSSISAVVTENTGDSTGGKSAKGQTISSSATKKTATTGEKKPSKLTEATKKNLFENIKENSGEYVLTQEEINKGAEEKKAAAEPLEVKYEGLSESEEEAEMDQDLTELSKEAERYIPEYQKSSGFYILIISIILIVLVILLILALFFIVLLFEETESVYLGEKKKKLVAIRLITINKKAWSINVNDLLSTHPSLEAHLGVLFVYIFEGDYVKILSKVHGDEKREIAKEEIKRQVIIGKGRGKRR